MGSFLPTIMEPEKLVQRIQGMYNRYPIEHMQSIRLVLWNYLIKISLKSFKGEIHTESKFVHPH